MNKKTIAWLVPRLLEGSGGHRTILEHAAHLEKQGYRCVIYLEGVPSKGPLGQLSPSELIEKLFQLRFSQVELGWGIKECDVAVATIWYSAFAVSELLFDCAKLYFVQDYEAWFNPVSYGYLRAAKSYSLPLEKFTIGRGLTAKLISEHESRSQYFDFGADLDVYRPSSKGGAGRKAICFVFQPDKPRRCWELGIEALTIVAEIRPDIKIYLYGSSRAISPKIPKSFNHLGLLTVQECNDLYNRSTVGLCISATNPSRVPFEMMASGMPVVDLHLKNNLYDFPEQGMLLADVDPRSIATALLSLIEDEASYTLHKEGALRFMSGRSLANEKEMFARHLNNFLTSSPGGKDIPETVYTKKAVTYSKEFLQRWNSAKAAPSGSKKNPLRRRYPVSRLRRRLSKIIAF